MGKLCSKSSQSVSSAMIETEQEVSLPSYKSDADSYFELIENKYNYLRKLCFVDYLHSLVNFSNENATLEDDYTKASLEHSMNESFFTELFSTDILQSFLENKILKHKALYEEAGNNEKVTSIFKEVLFAANNGLGLKLSQNAKANGDENADKNTIVKKGDALAYGILYCVGPNYAKVRALFNLFKTDNVVKSSEKFSGFLLSLFIVASYGMCNARNKAAKFEEVGEIEKEKLKELLQTSELQDCQHLVDVTNIMFFGDNKDAALDYNTFKGKFSNPNKESSMSFLLSAPGVRFMLNKNNVQ